MYSDEQRQYSRGVLREDVLAGQNVPVGVSLQLIISQSYNTPAVIGCAQAVEQHFVPVANIPNVVFYTAGSLAQPAATDPNAPAISLLPGESAFVTMRALDTTTNNPAQALAHYNPATATTPGIVSQGANTGTTTPPIALVIVPVSLAPATATRPYSKPLTATGGTGTYAWSSSGNLPAGIQLSAAGVLAGTTAATGSFTFTAKVTSGTQSASTQLTLLVNPAPAILTTTLNAGDRGFPFSQQLTSTGGTLPIAWSAAPGSLPGGLALSSAGLLSGTPTATGPFSPNVTITDANGATASRTFSLTIAAALAISTASVPNAEQGAFYTTAVAAAGGTAPLVWSIASGALPNGLNLSATGTISGTPTVSGGPFAFTLRVTDAIGAAVTRPYSIMVAAALQITTGPVTGFQGSTYPATVLAATGGTPPYTWSGAAIAGMNLTSAGILTGFPTAAGTGTVTVMDSNGGSVSAPFTIAGTAVSALDFTITNVSVNGAGRQITAAPGAPINVSVSFNIADNACPGCVEFIQIAFANGPPPNTACAYKGIPGLTPGATGTGSVSLTAPSVPGRYYIGVDREQDFQCNNFWWDGTPGPDRYIAVVDVNPTPSVTRQAVTFTGISVTPQQVSPGGTITAAFSWSMPASGTIGLGFNTSAAMIKCGGLNYGPVSQPLTAPSLPGRYYLSIDNPNTCLIPPAASPWQSGVPGSNFARYIGAVDVH